MTRRNALIAIVLAMLVALCMACGCTQAPSANQQNSGSGEFSVDAEKARIEGEVAEKLAQMTVEEKVAQLFIVNANALDDLAEEGKDPFERYPVGGFIYFEDDLEDPDQVRTMLENAQEHSRAVTGLPAFLCVDEEGGAVVRVASNEAFGVEDVGDMSAIGQSGDTERARSAAEYVGGYLVDLGFNVVFAPVADVAADEDDVMADRSFGSDPQAVAAMVAAQVEGFGKTGILCTAKHFPGLGGTSGDSHEEAVYNEMSLDEFRSTALVPFAAAIGADVPFVMVSHLSAPKVTGGDDPASVSPVWITDVLKGEMGFEGVVITDSLLMEAATDRYSQRELGVLAIEAGADMLLLPDDFEDMYQGVLDAVKSGRISEERLNDAVARILRVKLK